MVDRPDVIPFEPDSQRALSRRWSTLVGARGRDVLHAKGVRSVVRESWHRSFEANIAPNLGAAPLALDADRLRDVAAHSDWLGVAHSAIKRSPVSVAGDGHVLALFDHDGRMLHAEGDPAALDGLAEINFRPGADWSELAVGTNGPGTALANGTPTHIVGAEHFCERWQGWHCAAVPVHDIATGRIIGVVDISGFRTHAHPHTLALALALGAAIEQAIVARDMQRRFAILQRHTVLAARYPGDSMLAIDRAGRVVMASPSISTELTVQLIRAVSRHARHIGASDGTLIELEDHALARWFPVYHDRILIGGCLVLEPRSVAAHTESLPLVREDINDIALRLFQLAARDLGRLSVAVEPGVYAAFAAYHWPGGVRELKHVVRRIMNTAGATVRVRDLPHVIREAFDGGSDLALSAIDSEDARLMQVVRESRTMDEAAKRLGITRSTLYRRMERFGLKPRRVLGHE